MAEAVDPTTTTPILECPVCSEFLKDPKILPCAHLMCRTCVLSTLKTRAEIPSGCPFCQHPILASHETDTDLETFVDELPTDHGTWVKIESNKILKSDAVCMCDNDSEAVSFCFQCNLKLCKTCTKCHSRIPSCSDHIVEEFSTLTTEKLAVQMSMLCKVHKEKAVEKYCSAHEELVCMFCICTDHKNCDGFEDIGVSAQRKRKELDEQNKRLKQAETSLSDQMEELNKQITDAQVNFHQMRERVITVFMDIIKHYEAQKHKVLGDIDEKEQICLDEKLANRDRLQELRAAIAAHTISIDEFLSSSSDKSLLATLGKLQSRLDDLEKRYGRPIVSDRANVGDVYFNDSVVRCVMKMADIIGQVRDEPPKQTVIESPLSTLYGALNVIEGNFRYVLEDFDETVPELSPPCLIGNIPWRIEVKPHSDPNYTRISLLCDAPEHSTSWFCAVKGEIWILSVVPQGKHWEQGFEHKFQHTNSCCNIANPFKWRFTDPQRGHLKDGRVTLEVHIVVKDHKGLGQQ